ncbi:sensor domain-containing diguanylate cyclase [Mycobacterium sp. MBM]|nr:sensor domain-containing diguanylate cyclase [Mycobacterium sp. MBM]
MVAENSADTLIRGTLDGVRRYVSPSIRTLLGYTPDELVGKRASENMHPDDVADFVPKMLALREGTIDSFVTEHRQRHKDGSWVWMEAFVRVTEDPRSGRRDGYVVSVRDTSRRKELETELAHNASHDVLTGLPNRALLYERLGTEIEHGGEFAVLCVDLDGFKRVNDELGHHVGDLVLAAVADRLVSCVGARDTVARRGGDEFVIIHVADAPLLDSAVALARCVIDAASAPMAVAEWSGSIGLSIGIALGAGPDAHGEELLRAADRAMYEAKASGHNAYRIAGPR